MRRATKNTAGVAVVGLCLSTFAARSEQPDLWKTYWEAAMNTASDVEREKLLLGALKEAERMGPRHPRVAFTLNHLCGVYQSRGRIAEAETCYRRALAMSEKGGAWSPKNMAVSLNNLAMLYSEQGKDAEAESYFKRALEVTEKAFGPEHPEVAAHLNNLAAFYKADKKYAAGGPYIVSYAMCAMEGSLGSKAPARAREERPRSRLAGWVREPSLSPVPPPPPARGRGNQRRWGCLLVPGLMPWARLFRSSGPLRERNLARVGRYA